MGTVFFLTFLLGGCEFQTYDLMNSSIEAMTTWGNSQVLNSSFLVGVNVMASDLAQEKVTFNAMTTRAMPQILHSAFLLVVTIRSYDLFQNNILSAQQKKFSKEC